MLGIGSVVDRKYKILSEIGHGGMSVVYLAINERANKTWAIKEVRKDGVVDFEAVKQGLVVETDMLKKLNHPHLPSIIDVIDLDDSFLIVMDYIEGKSLQSVLKHGGAQPLEQVLEWGKQLCDVLGYLHAQQPPIIYRDMKPANVMLKPDGNVMLIDFGTAREFKDRAMVEDTTCLGTRGYAAPEQFGGRGQTDGRTDIYCLGATLYHLLTGHSPADPPYEIKPLRYWDPSYADTGIEKLITKCTQQDPGARYQSCDELMYALEHVRDEDQKAIKSRRRRFTAFAVSAGVCLLGLLGMLGFGLARNGAQKETYDYLVQQIESGQAQNEELLQLCKQAVELSPGSPEAYAAYLRVMNGDGRLEEAEKLNLSSVFSTSQGSSFEVLRSENRAEYDKLCYRLGYSYYLFSELPDKDKTAGYLANVQDSENLSEQEKVMSTALYKIAKYEPSLEKQGLNLDVEYTYQDFFTDLQAIGSGNLEATLANPAQAVALYRVVSVNIYKRCAEFKNRSINMDQVKALLDEVEAGLNRIESAGFDDAEMMKQARSNLRNAYGAYESVVENKG